MRQAHKFLDATFQDVSGYKVIHIDHFKSSEKYPYVKIKEAIEKQYLRVDHTGKIICDYFYERILRVGFEWSKLRKWTEPIGRLHATRRGYRVYKVQAFNEIKGKRWTFAQVFTPEGNIHFFLKWKTWDRNYEDAKTWIDSDDMAFQQRNTMVRDIKQYGKLKFAVLISDALLIRKYLPINRETQRVHNFINTVLDKYGYDLDKPQEEQEDDYRQISDMGQQENLSPDDSI